jgi:hypothetical protein
MNGMSVMRYTILVIAAAATVIGILVMSGLLVPRGMPEQFRFLIGLVVALYGIYRFVIAYYRKSER